MSKKIRRFRLFAGPNGSGKTTFFKKYKDLYNPGLNINADSLQALLHRRGFVNLNELGISSTEDYFTEFRNQRKSLFEKAKKEDSPISLIFRDGLVMREKGEPTAYEASFLSAFLRHECIRLGISFSSESVMSHRSRLDELKEANAAGFRTYLYYLCTDSPIINRERVKIRVQKGGHDVPDEKVESRYYKSLELALDAAILCYRAFFFDTSKREDVRLLAEMENGEKLTIHEKSLNNWFVKYIYDQFYNIS